MDEHLVINLEDVQFNADGTVTIKNVGLKEKLEAKLNTADLLTCVTNNNYGVCGEPRVNVGGCANVGCNDNIFTKENIKFSGDDEIKIQNTKFNSELLQAKLNTSLLPNKDMQINIKNFKQV